MWEWVDVTLGDTVLARVLIATFPGQSAESKLAEARLELVKMVQLEGAAR